MKLLPIVEGPGDIEAVSLLLRRLLHDVHGRYDVEIVRPYKFGNYPKVDRDFDRYLLAAEKEGCPILWTMDCDDGCAVQLVETLKQRIPAGFSVPVGFAFFVREYEGMFLCEKECLTHLGITLDHALSIQGETVRDAKQTISRLMPHGQAYKETVHQTRLSARLNLELARRKSRSFRHLESELLKLIS
jgi:hypothetical protein